MEEKIWKQPIEVLGLTGDWESGKTLFGLTIDPKKTLIYDVEKSAKTYESLGFKRIDVPKEMMLYKKGAEYTPTDLFLWWSNHFHEVTPMKYSVIMLDPVSEIENGLVEYVRSHPEKFGKTAAQYVKMSGLMWGDVKDLWKRVLADLSSRCETFVFTSHLTSIWQNDRPLRGQKKPKGKETLMELATLYLWLERKWIENGREIKSDIPRARVIKSRLSSFIHNNSKIQVVPTLPPTIPGATPQKIKEYMAKPPDYKHLTSAEQYVPDSEITDDDRLEMQLAIAEAKRDTEALKLEYSGSKVINNDSVNQKDIIILQQKIKYLLDQEKLNEKQYQAWENNIKKATTNSKQFEAIQNAIAALEKK